jgi:hypothetical protein
MRKLGSGTTQWHGSPSGGHARRCAIVVEGGSLAPQASSDEHLIQLWLDGRYRRTRRVDEAGRRMIE